MKRPLLHNSNFTQTGCQKLYFYQYNDNCSLNDVTTKHMPTLSVSRMRDQKLIMTAATGEETVLPAGGTCFYFHIVPQRGSRPWTEVLSPVCGTCLTRTHGMSTKICK
ncbi:hypothetical protein NPIL_672201 [Nephila pilipes]|uniref:Uncharacterized protein n=1 Tax=Nephila pilipes TaxID=299642 RepID=A0A8X6NSF2_NEPPI|nr:hypothetical protein NPIL_672201 [Nephila pilipes]